MTLGATLRMFSPTRDRLRPIAVAPILLAMTTSLLVFGGLFLFIGFAGMEHPHATVVSEVVR
ncbi:hypothetical protein [Consotaella salsifontis]|uniref:Uncharacterized protein n=1 Tax=Consotaella salsifontis TaxID=1365950 RepID=A0A1T4SEU3_9HYPH|nr:hypothetical protein [Consotaella salsifontis]SKA26712.1 hypothetical protein SAMN05428963_110114 [Consotaella salsifontis]